MKDFEDYKKTVKSCHEESSNFQIDLYSSHFVENPFYYNFKNLFPTQSANPVFYLDSTLSEKKKFDDNKELASNYWSAFKAETNGSKLKLLQFREHFASYLEGQLFPTYFNRLEAVTKYYLESDGSKELYEKHPEKIQEIIGAFYSGDYDGIQLLMEEEFYKNYKTSSNLYLRKDLVSRFLERILMIWEMLFRIHIINMMLRTSIHTPVESKQPFEEIPKWEDLSKSEKEDLEREQSEYIPHPNTRKGLVEDLRKIIEEIKSNPHYFNGDGTIKHVSVSKYAIDQKWFSDKYDNPTHEGLHKHVRRIHDIEYNGSVNS